MLNKPMRTSPIKKHSKVRYSFIEIYLKWQSFRVYCVSQGNQTAVFLLPKQKSIIRTGTSETLYYSVKPYQVWDVSEGYQGDGSPFVVIKGGLIAQCEISLDPSHFILAIVLVKSILQWWCLNPTIFLLTNYILPLNAVWRQQRWCNRLHPHYLSV